MRLILLLLPITFFTKADMDYICGVFIFEGMNDSTYSIENFIAKNCERNNILTFNGGYKKINYNLAQPDESPVLIRIPFSDLIARYCRFDRNINDELIVFYDGSEIRQISCVLYDNEPRLNIK